MLPIVEPLRGVNGEDVATVLVRAALECVGFFGSEELFAFEFLRTLERRGRAEVPEALEIRMSIGRARWRRWPLRCESGAERERDEGRTQGASLHVRGQYLDCCGRLS